MKKQSFKQFPRKNYRASLLFFLSNPKRAIFTLELGPTKQKNNFESFQREYDVLGPVEIRTEGTVVLIGVLLQGRCWVPTM